MANLKDSKESTSHKLGDKIEKVGQRVSEKAPKTGRAIYDAGDKIEHLNDKKSGKRQLHPVVIFDGNGYLKNQRTNGVREI